MLGMIFSVGESDLSNFMGSCWLYGIGTDVGFVWSNGGRAGVGKSKVEQQPTLSGAVKCCILGVWLWSHSHASSI